MINKEKAESDDLSTLIQYCCQKCRLCYSSDLTAETKRIYMLLIGKEKNIPISVKAEILPKDKVRMTVTTSEGIGQDAKDHVVEITYSQLLNFVNGVKKLYEDRINRYEQEIIGYRNFIHPRSKTIADSPGVDTSILKDQVKRWEGAVRTCEKLIEDNQNALNDITKKINKVIPSDDFRKLEQAEEPEQSSKMRKGKSF